MKNKKVGLIILDGIGVSKNKKGNALKLAKTPTFDSLLKTCPHSLLQASGPAVGLPVGQMGNSEIGHMNIGVGQVVKSDLVRINDDVKSKKFYTNPNLLKTFKLVKAAKTKLHLVGLCSTGGVHSQLNHIIEIIKLCIKHKVNTVIHAISDGRDTSTTDFVKDLKTILDLIGNTQYVQLGTIGGRYYYMDRNQNWDRINLAIKAMLNQSDNFVNPLAYINKCYKNKITDEFIQPVFNAAAKNIKLEKNDFILIANFRPDRVRQISHFITKSNLYKTKSPLWPLKLHLVTMTKYDGIESEIILYPPVRYKDTLGEVIAKNNLKQLRIAETEKYAHVTFFFDGGVEQNFKGEQKILVPSPNVKAYDLKPEMSAYEITDKLIANMAKFNVFICNYANGDMVGHTGNLKATIKAVEAVDTCLAKVLPAAKKMGFTLFITADHGNCDNMLDKNNKPVTTHSLAPVYLVCTDPKIKLKNGKLSDIAPLIKKYLNI